jgi:hypothetical protein
LLTDATDAVTVGGDKGFDVPSFVAGVRALVLRLINSYTYSAPMRPPPGGTTDARAF